MPESYEQLRALGARFGESFYVLDTARFADNYRALTAAFRKVYPRFAVAYSYKTNYIPRLCRLVNELGGYAEVVSDMEYQIARRVGVPPERVVFNGPCKAGDAVRELLLSGGTVNADSPAEVAALCRLAKQHPDSTLRVGLRVNFPINDGVLSRFGLDAESDALPAALAAIAARPNLRLAGLHCHFACRRLDTWTPRARGMLALLDRLGLLPERIDLGGGLFGRMDESLRAQFDTPVPSYAEYAAAVAPLLAERYGSLPEERQPLLLLEPGSALVGDCMRLAAPVRSVKLVRGQAIATVLASRYNLNMGTKNPPLRVAPCGAPQTRARWDIAGYTCIEGDYLYRGYDGPLAEGDYLVFDNVGSYSIVFKPPFILPNFAVVEPDGQGGAALVKRPETFDDLFQTYQFPGPAPEEGFHDA